jgi:hypothetical protein
VCIRIDPNRCRAHGNESTRCMHRYLQMIRRRNRRSGWILRIAGGLVKEVGICEQTVPVLLDASTSVDDGN